MIGASAESWLTSSQRSPGQPLLAPRTELGNWPASDRQFSQVPTSM